MSDRNKKKKIIKEELRDNKEIENKEIYEKTINDLEEKLQIKDEEINNLKDQINRLRAEFVEYKKALKRESNVILNSKTETMILKIIDILDHFNIALSHSENVDKNFVIGMKMIYRNLESILENQKVEKIIPVIGKTFDPFMTEVAETICTNEYEDMSVINIRDIGYKLNGKILKPAKVDVAMKPREVIEETSIPEIKEENSDSNENNKSNNQEKESNKEI